MTPKQAIREHILRLRNSLSPEERAEKSRAIVQRLTALESFKKARGVMLYITLGSEVQTEEAMEKTLGAGKRVFVPDAVGVLEVTERARRADPKEIDLVVVPGIAFDVSGNRLGYGTGWYDKFSHRLKAEAELIGLAFECQVVEQVPNHPHDIRVHTIITEKRVIISGR